MGAAEQVAPFLYPQSLIPSPQSRVHMHHIPSANAIAKSSVRANRGKMSETMTNAVLHEWRRLQGG